MYRATTYEFAFNSHFHGPGGGAESRTLPRRVAKGGTPAEAHSNTNSGMTTVRVKTACSRVYLKSVAFLLLATAGGKMAALKAGRKPQGIFTGGQVQSASDFRFHDNFKLVHGIVYGWLSGSVPQANDPIALKRLKSWTDRAPMRPSLFEKRANWGMVLIILVSIAASNMYCL